MLLIFYAILNGDVHYLNSPFSVLNVTKKKKSCLYSVADFDFFYDNQIFDGCGVDCKIKAPNDIYRIVKSFLN